VVGSLDGRVWAGAWHSWLPFYAREDTLLSMGAAPLDTLTGGGQTLWDTAAVADYLRAGAHVIQYPNGRNAARDPAREDRHRHSRNLRCRPHQQSRHDRRCPHSYDIAAKDGDIEDHQKNDPGVTARLIKKGQQ
jgi:hypothetical protein